MTTTPEPGRGPDGRGTALDPTEDPAVWNALVRRIVGAAESELARRRRSSRSARGLLFERWARPVLVAAASLILLAAGSLLRGPGAGESDDATASPSLEEVLFPPVVARWMSDQAPPTVEEVVFAPSGDDG